MKNLTKLTFALTGIFFSVTLIHCSQQPASTPTQGTAPAESQSAAQAVGKTTPPAHKAPRTSLQSQKSQPLFGANTVVMINDGVTMEPSIGAGVRGATRDYYAHSASNSGRNTQRRNSDPGPTGVSPANAQPSFERSNSHNEAPVYFARALSYSQNNQQQQPVQGAALYGDPRYRSYENSRKKSSSAQQPSHRSQASATPTPRNQSQGAIDLPSPIQHSVNDNPDNGSPDISETNLKEYIENLIRDGHLTAQPHQLAAAGISSKKHSSFARPLGSARLSAAAAAASSQAPHRINVTNKKGKITPRGSAAVNASLHAANAAAHSAGHVSAAPAAFLTHASHAPAATMATGGPAMNVTIANLSVHVYNGPPMAADQGKRPAGMSTLVGQWLAAPSSQSHAQRQQPIGPVDINQPPSQHASAAAAAASATVAPAPAPAATAIVAPLVAAVAAIAPAPAPGAAAAVHEDTGCSCSDWCKNNCTVM